MAEQHKTGWRERRKEAKRAQRKRLKRERAGPSPEKLAERHEPKGGVVDKMLKLGGIERESRFKK